MKEQIIAINQILAGYNHIELDVFEYKNNGSLYMLAMTYVTHIGSSWFSRT